MSNDITSRRSLMLGVGSVVVAAGLGSGSAGAQTSGAFQEAPSTNLYNSPAYGLSMPNLGNTIDAVTKRGAYFAVCDAATHFLSEQLAGMLGGNADAIYKDLAASLIPNSRLVSAGVMAVTRSQEHGYSLLYAG